MLYLGQHSAFTQNKAEGHQAMWRDQRRPDVNREAPRESSSWKPVVYQAEGMTRRTQGTRKRATRRDLVIAEMEREQEVTGNEADWSDGVT